TPPSRLHSPRCARLAALRACAPELWSRAVFPRRMRFSSKLFMANSLNQVGDCDVAAFATTSPAAQLPADVRAKLQAQSASILCLCQGTLFPAKIAHIRFGLGLAFLVRVRGSPTSLAILPCMPILQCPS